MKKLIFLLCILAGIACQKSQPTVASFDSVKDEKMISALTKAYHLSSFNQEASPEQTKLITASLESNDKYNNILSKIDMPSLKIFSNKQENIIVAMFNFENTSEKLFSVKGYFSNNKFVITNDFLYGRKLKDKENGQIIITNNNDATLINIVNGVQTYSPIESQSIEFKALQMNDCEGNHGGTGFCQRQAGERFSDCYKSEKDEFCDGFWSCIAVDTQPQVMLLIAAACSCGASPCIVKK
jgi:hypothetical protein